MAKSLGQLDVVARRKKTSVFELVSADDGVNRWYSLLFGTARTLELVEPSPLHLYEGVRFIFRDVD